MKLLLVNKLYPPDVGGGAEIMLANIAAGMQARGHEILVATTSAAATVSEHEVAAVRVIRVPLRNLYWHHGPTRQSAIKRALWHARDSHNGAMGAALRRVIQQFDPDVVAFHNLAGFSAAAWDAAFAQGKPTIQVLHDYYHLCPRSQLFRNGSNCASPCGECRLFRRGRAKQSNLLKAVIGVSHAVLDSHVRNGLFAGVGIRTVINNARVFDDVGARAYPRLATTFGFIGTLAEWKGIRQLLEAFRRVQNEPNMPQLTLLVAGRGEAAYEAELRASFASEQIVFLGNVAPETFYRRIHVCVVPSIWHDPLPSVVFESLLFGVPVIGSRRGGIPEMVSDGGNGLLYEPDEPGTLERCIRSMASVPDLLRDCGERARRESGRFADMDRVVDEHLAVCERVR